MPTLYCLYSLFRDIGLIVLGFLEVQVELQGNRSLISTRSGSLITLWDDNSCAQEHPQRWADDERAPGRAISVEGPALA